MVVCKSLLDLKRLLLQLIDDLILAFVLTNRNTFGSAKVLTLCLLDLCRRPIRLLRFIGWYFARFVGIAPRIVLNLRVDFLFRDGECFEAQILLFKHIA